MSNRGSSIGPLNEGLLSDPLQVARKINRDRILNLSTGADFFQSAVVVEIDPVGGLFGNPDSQIGAPRYSIRARILNQGADGANSDALRGTDELKICFPFSPNYHDHNPIKVGESVWVFELQGINGLKQRYWLHRRNLPSPLSLDPFVRPNNNFATAAFEANLFRDGDDVLVDRDRRESDTIEKISQRTPGVLGEVESPDSARSHFSRVANDSAGIYGFVNESFPEWFFRPSDRVIQGSNNSGILFGTNEYTIESEDEDPDIADIISIYGGSNDASDYANARDREVMRADRAPIAVGAEERTATGHMIAGRRFPIQSLTFDASRFSVFENVNIDSAAPFIGQTVSSVGGSPSEKGPSALVRTTNLRQIARRSALVALDSGSGLYLDTQEEGDRFLATFSRRSFFKVGAAEFEMDAQNGFIKMEMGIASKFDMKQTSIDVEAIGQAIRLNETGIEISTPSILKLGFSQLSLPAPPISTGGPPIKIAGELVAGASSGTPPAPVITKREWSVLTEGVRSAGLSLSTGILAPVGAQLQGIAGIMDVLSEGLSTSLKG